MLVLVPRCLPFPYLSSSMAYGLNLGTKGLDELEIFPVPGSMSSISTHTVLRRALSLLRLYTWWWFGGIHMGLLELPWMGFCVCVCVGGKCGCVGE